MEKETFLPWIIVGVFADVIVLKNVAEGGIRIHEWWELNWKYFFDEMSYDLEEIDVVALNRMKELYGYPSMWGPDEVINYCMRMGINPFSYPWSRSIRRDEKGEVIPYDEPDVEVDFGTFLSECELDIIPAKHVCQIASCGLFLKECNHGARALAWRNNNKYFFFQSNSDSYLRFLIPKKDCSSFKIKFDKNLFDSSEGI